MSENIHELVGIGDTISEQSLTTANGRVDITRLYEIRSRNVDLEASQRIGKIGAGGGIGSAADCLSVLHFEPLFTYNRRANIEASGMERVFNTASLEVFSSFNAMKIGDAKNQEDFESRFRFIGFSLGEVRAEETSQPGSGIAFVMAGSWSTRWLGTTRIFPGDRFIVRPPLIDKAARERERSKIPFQTIYDKEKILGSFEVWDPSFVKRELSRAIARLMEGTAAIKTSFLSRPSDMTHQDEIALRIKQFILTTVASGVAVLAKVGAITINTPSEADPFARFSYSRHAKFHNNDGAISDFDDIFLEGKPGNDLKQTNLVSLPEATRTSLLNNRNKACMYLATLIGAVDHPDEFIKPAENIQEAILGTILARHGLNYDADGNPDAKNTVELYDPHRLLSSPHSRQNFSMGSIEHQFIQNARDSFTHLSSALTAAIDHSQSQIAGKAISIAMPGTKVDYII